MTEQKEPSQQSAPQQPPPAEQPPAAAQPPPADQPTVMQPTPPPPAAPRRSPHMTRTWIAGVAAAVLLVVGGVGGYVIGAAGDRDGPGWYQDHPREGFRGQAPPWEHAPWHGDR